MPKQMIALRLDPDLLAAMRELKAREGIPISIQVDFALRKWLQAKGALKGTTTRKQRTR